MGGWNGKLLRVDLGTGKSTVEDIPHEWREQYIGGRGLAARYLYETMDPKAEPLSPDNKMIFATGPLTGTPVPCGARYTVVTTGALTGAITTSTKSSMIAAAVSSSKGRFSATMPPKAETGSHFKALP